MNDWLLEYEGFNPAQEGLRETLCTLGNGYFATRGAAAEAQADGVHYPGTYLAGCYNRLGTEIAGRVIENEDLVNFPNWLLLTFRCPDGDWFNLGSVEILDYRQVLDLKQGVLLRTVRFKDNQGRQTTMVNRRFVHMRHPNIAALETQLTPENWSGQLMVRSALDGRVVNSGVARYRQLNNKHLVPLVAEDIGQDAIFLKMQTSQSEIRLALAARTTVFCNGQLQQANRRAIVEPDYVAHELVLDMAQNKEVRIEKLVAIHSSRERASSECGLEARKRLSRISSLEVLLKEHRLAWEHLWNRFDIETDHDEPQGANRISLTLRLHLFHLLQTTSMYSIGLDAGVPARGWHGEAYRGHIFWDELFIFPILNLRIPEVARALLMYRHRRLNEARAAAQSAGFKGAMYPWQSGSDGREESQKVHLNPKSGRWIPDNSQLQRHVNSAIAYNVWQYYQVTHDNQFLFYYGAEMILEIARFWASIATYNAGLDRYEILGVMGPDEYHDAYPDAEEPGLNNNAYTNIMAVWVICTALTVLNGLPEDRREHLADLLELTPDEIARWDEISRKMRIVFHGDGIISQFEGYEKLAEFDWEGYRGKHGDIQRLDRILEAEGTSANRFQVSKQADTLMLFYLFSSEELGWMFERLGYTFDRETIPRNIEYYLRRTSHGSTLSRVAHSWVLARSDRAQSWQLFVEALNSDIADIQGGTTPEGIHLGAMAGTVSVIQQGYTGLETRSNVLWLNPCLPHELARLRLKVFYHGQLLDIESTRHKLTVTALRREKETIRIGFRGQVHDIRGVTSLEFVL